jgi:hypothetical protein
MANPDDFVVGDTAVLRALFTVESVPTDPSSATLVVKKPTGTVLTPAPTVTDVGTGTWRAEWDLTESGRWRWYLTSTGNAKAAEKGSFFVEASDV